VKKREIENLLTEQIEIPKEKFTDLMKVCFKESHDFIFLDSTSQRLFSNWDEIILDE
jgi:hypothetical protein